jgi:hypothetical protein
MKTDENFGSVRRFGFRAPRVSINFSFLLEVIATGERHEAVCTDISEDGLAAELLEPLAPKTQVTMRMLLPGGTIPLQIQGSVEYSQDRRCGLNFLYSSPEERKQVQLFIQSIS